MQIVLNYSKKVRYRYVICYTDCETINNLLIVTHLLQTTYEKIVTNREIAHYKKFLLYHKSFNFIQKFVLSIFIIHIFG